MAVNISKSAEINEIKGTLLALRQFLATEGSLKMTKKYFHSQDV